MEQNVDMKITSLGNNCFWGLLAKSISLQSNDMIFFNKTCFLSYGIMSTNNNKIGITAVNCIERLLTYCNNDDYSWINYNNVDYRSANGLVREWINYYLYNDKTMPLFFRHINDIYIDNPKFLDLIKYQTQYKENPADKYLLAVEDHNINSNTIESLNNISDILHSWNINSELIVFSQIRLDSDNFKNVVIPLGHCRWKTNEDYTVDEQTFKSICNAIQFNVNATYFLDKSKKPECYNSKLKEVSNG